MDGLEIARVRIAEEAEAQTGNLDLGRLGLICLPDELFELHQLHLLNLGSRFSYGNKHIEASANIAPNLIYQDLAQLINLPALRRLFLREMPIPDLAPIYSLQQLYSLDCSVTSVSDLTPLHGLTALQRLNCSNTSVSDLTPLQELTALTSLTFSNSPVKDLTPLQGLLALEFLGCWSTSVSDLTPLQGLTALQRLNCSNTSVSDLTPLQGLPMLEELHIHKTRIKFVAPDFWNNAGLKTLYGYQTELFGFPNEVFSQSSLSDENCLPAIRAHVTDLGNAPVLLNQVKLMVLGNGRIGKTQICNRLRDLPYEDKADSTHGINVTEAPIPGVDGTFAIWDFGGQDIYHGTHALRQICCLKAGRQRSLRNVGARSPPIMNRASPMTLCRQHCYVI